MNHKNHSHSGERDSVATLPFQCNFIPRNFANTTRILTLSLSLPFFWLPNSEIIQWKSRQPTSLSCASATRYIHPRETSRKAARGWRSGRWVERGESLVLVSRCALDEAQRWDSFRFEYQKQFATPEAAAAAATRPRGEGAFPCNFRRQGGF